MRWLTAGGEKEYVTMRTACLAVLTLLVAAPAAPAGKPSASAGVPARVQLRKQHLDRKYPKAGAHVKVDFPEVVGLADARLQARINRTIRSSFPPPHGLEAWLATGGGDPKQREVEELEGQFQVTLNRNHLLSVRFYGSEMLLIDGVFRGNHPNPQNAAVTLDTRTGIPYKLSELFAGPRWRERLETLIARNVAQEPGTHKPDAGDPALIEDLKAHEYWYYLTPRSIRFYDLYRSYAGHAVESEIPLEQLRPLMNPQGPLPSLLSSTHK